MSIVKKLDIDDERFRITPLEQAVVACTGALITSLSMTPLDVIKIRLQVQQKAGLSNKCFLYCNGLMDHLCPCATAPTAQDLSRGTSKMGEKPIRFNGTIDALLKISRAEGVSTLWSGLAPTLVLAVPATVIYFVTYEQLRLELKDNYNKKYNLQISERVQPLWIPMIAGSTARIIAASIVSPLELIRTKMQSQKLSYLELGIGLKLLLRQQGVFGLWRGVSSTLLRDVPFSVIYWVNYETMKQLSGSHQPSFLFSFFAGALSGSIAAIVTIPFDVVKTHQQIEFGENEIYSKHPVRTASTVSIFRRIYRTSGIKGLFAGVIPRLVKVAPACAIMIGTFEYGKSFFRDYKHRVYTKNELGNELNISN